MSHPARRLSSGRRWWVMADARTSDERVEDAAFQRRIRTLTEARKWNELRAVLMVYGSALDERDGADE